MPPWQDKSTLGAHICLSDNAIDAWVKMGLLPAPKKRGGKLMWRWSEVDTYLTNGGPVTETLNPSDMAEKIRDATRRAAAGG